MSNVTEIVSIKEFQATVNKVMKPVRAATRFMQVAAWRLGYAI